MTAVTFEIYPDPDAARIISCELEDLGYSEEEWVNATDEEKEEAILNYIEDEEKADWCIQHIKIS